MNVGIITRHAYPNYGSLLQAYALQEAIQQLGHNAVCIDYVNKNEDSWRLCFSQLKESRMNSSIIKRFIFCMVQLPNYTINTYAFQRMQNQYLKLTSRFRSKDEIHLDDIDVYCTGSDQVWNQIHNELDLSYFLEFTPDDAVRIAYAASFGRDYVDDCDKEMVKHYIERYKTVSVREESGANILKQMGINCSHVVDPVLLFDMDFWEKEANDRKEKLDYVLIYQLHYNKELTRIAQKLANEKGLKVIRLTCELKQRFIKNEKVIYLPNIADFLGYIRAAKYVVTDSFHGTAFSILFHRQFVEVMPGVNKTRNENLLKLANLRGRFVDINNVTKIADQKIDYQEVECLLADARKRSWEYLAGALNN